jgi:hypothetical protein
LVSQNEIRLEILEPALAFVRRCPLDSRVIDGTFPTLKCPVCGATYCVFPCAEKLVAKDKKCPVCKQYQMHGMMELVRSTSRLTKLEEVRTAGGVSEPVYQKLKREYERRRQETLTIVYSGNSPRSDEDAAYCSICGGLASYIRKYGRWYCYWCKRYLPIR